MNTTECVKAEAARISAFFKEAGATPVWLDILQPVGALLDLYGEDIRARAYVTHDPLRGEMMLRPDFTAPLARMHMSGGKGFARYTYAGEVFRAQERETGRPGEYLQVGYEIFGHDDPAAADAEVFALIGEALSHLPLTATTGDLGILMAAVRGLRTTERRRAALERHIWRPHRFRILLDRFSGRSPVPRHRAQLLEEVEAHGVDGLVAEAGQIPGLRTRAEIVERLESLRLDAAEPPIGDGEAELLDEIVTLRETAPKAIVVLRDLAADVPSILPAVERMEARMEAMANRGVDLSELAFEGSHGRTTLEYYDGFVFGFSAPARPELPPVAVGGRYDALTGILGRGRSVPAVGGAIRPGLAEEMKGGTQ